MVSLLFIVTQTVEAQQLWFKHGAQSLSATWAEIQLDAPEQVQAQVQDQIQVQVHVWVQAFVFWRFGTSQLISPDKKVLVKVELTTVCVALQVT